MYIVCCLRRKRSLAGTLMKRICVTKDGVLITTNGQTCKTTSLKTRLELKQKNAGRGSKGRKPLPKDLGLCVGTNFRKESPKRESGERLGHAAC